MSRVRDALAGVSPFTDLTPRMGEFRPRLGTTRSGYAKLIELDDADAMKLTPGDWLVVQFSYGLGPVEVVTVAMGVAGEGASCYEVPKVRARIPTGQVLAFAPEELCRVRESKGGRQS